MPRARTWIVDRVAARVDVLRPNAQITGGQTGIEAPMPLIEDELNDSAEFVLRNAPVELLFSIIQSDKKHFHGTSAADVNTRVIIDSKLKALIPCPDDFLRFVSCRLSSWTRSLKELMDTRDPRYKFQEGNKYTSGSWDKPLGALVSFSDYISAELTKYTIAQTLTQNQTVSTLANGVTPVGGTVLSTGNIIVLTGQTNPDENGTYLVNATGAPTLLTKDTVTVNRKMALELYRAKASNDTLAEFHYIPRLLPEQMPNELLDVLIYHCAGRVFTHLGDIEAAKIAFTEADKIMMTYKTGLMGQQ